MAGFLHNYLSQSGGLNSVNSSNLNNAPSGAGYAYDGFIGAEVIYDADMARRNTNLNQGESYSSTSYLNAGVYKLVRMKSALTIAAARGLAVYWDAAATLGVNRTAYTVTTDNPGKASTFAGVLLNAASASNLTMIQIDGLAWVKCKATLTTTGAVGQALFIDGATATFDNKADATAITTADVQNMKAVAFEAPANGALKRAFLCNVAHMNAR